MDGQKKRRGPAPKPASEVKSTNLTVRIRDGFRERLAALAARSGRSLSEELEHLVMTYVPMREKEIEESRDPVNVVGEAVKHALRLSRTSMGGLNYNQSDEAYEAANAAIVTIASMMGKPKGYWDRQTERRTDIGALGLGLSKTAEELRARRVGMAAADIAVAWDKGERPELDPKAGPLSSAVLTLYSQGRVGDPGYEPSALVGKIIGDVEAENGTEDQKE